MSSTFLWFFGTLMCLYVMAWAIIFQVYVEQRSGTLRAWGRHSHSGLRILRFIAWLRRGFAPASRDR